MNYIKKFLAITLIFVMQFQSVHASVAIGGGWSLNLTRVENSTNIFTAFKNGFQSTVAISPSSAQVAKSLLRGGLVGLALSAVTQALLDGIDYVMDSAKQEVRYKTANCGQDGSSCTSSPYNYYAQNWGKLGYFSSITVLMNNLSLNAQQYYPNAKVKFFEYADNDLSKLQGCPGYFEISYSDSRGNSSRDFSEVCRSYNKFYNSSAKPDTKSIPLTTLATQIINLAEQGNPDAKAYITSVVQDMLEHDEDYRKSLEAQLDAKLQEAQSIGSNNNGGNSNSGNNSATKPVPSTSGNSTTANPTPPNNDDEEDANQKIDNLLKNSRFLQKDKNKIYERNGGGGFDQVMKDFNSLGLKNIRNATKKPDEIIYIGQLRNNTWVTGRSWSKLDGRPTLEIAGKKIKIRY